MTAPSRLLREEASPAGSRPPARPPRHGLPAAPAARPCLQGDRGALQPLGAHGDPPRTPAGSGRERHGERGGEGRKGRCGSGGCQPRRGSPGAPLPPGAAERDALGPPQGRGVRGTAVSAGPAGESGKFSPSQPAVSAGRRNEPRGRDFSLKELEITDGELSPRHEPIEGRASIFFRSVLNISRAAALPGRARSQILPVFLSVSQSGF